MNLTTAAVLVAGMSIGAQYNISEPRVSNIKTGAKFKRARIGSKKGKCSSDVRTRRKANKRAKIARKQHRRVR